jgi:Ni/Co efflux regulator RcnB
MKILIPCLVGAALLLSAAQSVNAQPERRGPDNADASHPGWGQDHNDGQGWRQGGRMGYDDWNNAQPLDYRSHHLRQPPSGYEWRESNGRYVMAAVATGVIASIIVNGGR